MMCSASCAVLACVLALNGETSINTTGTILDTIRPRQGDARGTLFVTLLPRVLLPSPASRYGAASAAS